MIHDLADGHQAHARRKVEAAKGRRRDLRKIQPDAGLDNAERPVQRRLGKSHNRAAAGEVADCVRLGKRGISAQHEPELARLEDEVPARRQERAVRDAEFLMVARIVAQEPAAKIHSKRGRIINFDCLLSRRLRIGQHFIDPRIIQWQIIARGRRRRPRKAHDGRAAIRHPALRHAWVLCAEIH